MPADVKKMRNGNHSFQRWPYVLLEAISFSGKRLISKGINFRNIPLRYSKCTYV